jgi:hypothetical protein
VNRYANSHPVEWASSVQARLQDAKVDRMDSSTDIGVFLHDDALTRARLRPYATGGVLQSGTLSIL